MPLSEKTIGCWIRWMPCFLLPATWQDREEMARIKEESMPYYEQAQMAEDQLVRQTVDGNMENPFGIYLYYSKLFGRKDFSTKENIGAEREYQKNFGPEAQQTPYIALM